MKLNKKITLTIIAIVGVIGFIVFVPVVPYKATHPKSACDGILMGYLPGYEPICEDGYTTILAYLLNPRLRGE